jgi:DNA-binding NtrC family response regulator
LQGAHNTVNDRLRILLVDDDPSSRRTLTASLGRSGDEVDLAEDLSSAWQLARARRYDLLVCDARLPRGGAVLHEALRERSPQVAVVLVSAFASVEHVHAAFQQGVYDFLLKPVEPQHVAALLGRVRERVALTRRVHALRSAIALRDAFMALMSGGPTMATVQRRVREAAGGEGPVFIVGERGVGKTLTALAIHALSARAEGPIEVIDCAREPVAVQSELFGSATSTRAALLSTRGGVLVLESITAMPRALRARVLEAVVGADAPRVIVVAEGFPSAAPRRDARRSELLAWARATEVVIPPLRERREDIPSLVEHFLQKFRPGGGAPRVAPAVMAAFIEAPWRGNLRELERVVYESAGRSNGHGVIVREDLPPNIAAAVDRGSSLVEQVEAYERAVVRRALESANGAVARAALELGVPERTLRRKMRQFGIAKETFRKRSRYNHLLVEVPQA